MARVDDGELEMLLDGALHLLPEERAEEVRRYAETEEGRERLAAARSLRDRADAILGGVGSEIGAGGGGAGAGMPDFAEIRARAAAGGPAAGGGGGGAGNGPRVPGRRPSLLWAASIAAALVVGWMGRGLLPGAGGPTELGRQASAPAPAAAPGAVERGAPGEPGSLAEPGSPSEAAPSAMAEGTPSPSVGGRTVTEDTGTERTATADEALAADRTVATARAQAVDAAALSDVAAPADEVAFKVALEPRSPPLTWPPGWEVAAPPVSELPVLDVAVQGDTTLVLQALPEGGVLELMYVNVTLEVDRLVIAASGGAERRDAEAIAGRPVADPAADSRAGPATAELRARAATLPPGAAVPPGETGTPVTSSSRPSVAAAPGAPPTPTAILRLPFIGGGVELRAPVPDSVLARWGEEVVLRRIRGGEP